MGEEKVAGGKTRCEGSRSVLGLSAQAVAVKGPSSGMWRRPRLLSASPGQCPQFTVARVKI